MNILDQIIADKIIELKERKSLMPVSHLENTEYFNRTPNSLLKSLKTIEGPGIIAEFKRKSPSKGIINDNVKIDKITKGYVDAGVAGISVLTDTTYFGGSLYDLMIARRTNPTIPILRKDFIVDEYQILEAKAIGSDVILLIAACLSPLETLQLASFARSLALEVILEIHCEEELNHINDAITIVGVNNRNLKTMEVNIENSVSLFPKIDKRFIPISESGISHSTEVNTLFEVGYRGFLMGENFMRTADPAYSCKEFIDLFKK